MRSPRLAALTLKRLFQDSLLVRAAVVAITLVPLLYGALYLWAFWDPYAELDKMPVALVNLDEPAAVDGEIVSAGDDLVRALIETGTVEWHEVSAREASAGLAAGRYYLALTIPREFSADLGTANSESPVRARLHVTAQESSNMLASQIASRVFGEIRAAASEDATRRYLDSIYVGFADARGGFDDAAAGARTLAEGLADARSGARSLAGGATTAHVGASTLAAGLLKLDEGAAKARAGARSVASGNASLARGLATADSGAAQLAAGAEALGSGSAKLSAATGQIAQGAGTLAGSAGALESGAAQVHDGIDEALAQVGDAAASAGQVRDGAAALDAALRAYADANPDAAGDLEAALGLSAKVRAGSAGLAAGLCEAAQRGPALAGGAKQVAEGAEALHAGAVRLAAGATAADEGARDLASGATELEAGTASLAGGVHDASRGARSLAAGSSKLAAGTAALERGSADAADGAGTLAAGMRRLDAGAHSLVVGLTPAVSGSRELADGLADGTEELPDFDATTQGENAEMMSGPVALDTERRGEVPTYGTGFAPYFLPLALWIGALLTFFLIKPLPDRAVAAAAPAPVIALAGYLPAALIGVVQAVVLLAVVQFALGLTPVSLSAYYGFGIVTALVFVAILQMFNAALGTVGKLVSIVVLMLQLTSAGGTFPLQMVPAFFRSISPCLPMTHVVAGLRQAISGGDLHAVARSAAMLLVFGGVSILITIAAAFRAQTYTMERLHPSLEL